MTRSIDSSVATALIARTQPHLWLLVELPSSPDYTAPLRLTNYGRSFVWGAKTWTPLHGLEGKGFSENMNLAAPAASIKLPSLDATMQAYFLADVFRGTKCNVTVISQAVGTSIASAVQAWTTRYTIGPDAFDQDGVTLTLESADAVEGTEVPRQQVSEVGCIRDYMKGGCWYRGHRVIASSGLPPTSSLGATPQMASVIFTGCSKMLEDKDGVPGCKSHFPDILNPLWSSTGTAARVIRQPMPYSAYPGGDPNAVVL
jgi:hypothetical protein